jgi:hypothetical protein
MMVSLGDATDGVAHECGRNLYGDLYLPQGGYGVYATHDGEPLIFHARQFEHAFFTTSDKLCFPERKDVLRRGSIERIRWILPLLSGKVCGSACFEVPSPTGRRRPPNRLYAVYAQPFVVWLEPRQNGGWRFSSAYPLSIEEIHKYSRGGRTVCKWK